MNKDTITDRALYRCDIDSTDVVSVVVDKRLGLQLPGLSTRADEAEMSMTDLIEGCFIEAIWNLIHNSDLDAFGIRRTNCQLEIARACDQIIIEGDWHKTRPWKRSWRRGALGYLGGIR